MEYKESNASNLQREMKPTLHISLCKSKGGTQEYNNEFKELAKENSMLTLNTDKMTLLATVGEKTPSTAHVIQVKN